jgi:hypothetical protein
VKQGPGVNDVLMPSTPLAYPQVAWRRFASFRAANFRISAVHAALCAMVRFPAAPQQKVLVKLYFADLSVLHISISSPNAA